MARDPRFDDEEYKPPKKPWEDGDDEEPIGDERDEKPVGRRPKKVTGKILPYGQTGLGRQQPTTGIDPLGIAGDLLSRDASGWVRFSRFDKGIITAVKRGLQPRGSLADSQNFQPNTLIGSLQQRTGYASYLEPPLLNVDGSSLSAGLDKTWHLSTEFPEAKDIDVVLGWFQKPYWQSSNTATSSWRQWGENNTITVSAIAVDKTTITFSGTSATNDYYNNCRLRNITRAESVFIQDYVGATKIATPNEKIPTDWLTGDSYVFYRDFHDNPTEFQTFSAAITSQPNAVQQGNSILASTGQTSLVAGKLILSTFLDQTFFPGSGKSPRVWGTYVTEAEIKSTTGFTLGNASATAVTDGLDTNYRWFISYLYRTVDNQLSALQTPATNYIDPAAAQGIRATVTIDFPLMNKRIRYVEVFLGRTPLPATTEIDWAEYFHVETLDLTEAGWTYTESTTTPGQYSKVLTYDQADWNGISPEAELESSTVVDWTGTTRYNRSTVSASLFGFHKGRLFVAKSYDYYSAQNDDDGIIWSGYSGVLGTPQLNVLPDTPGHSTSSIESGDPSSITGLNPLEDELVILKDSSCYKVDASDPDPVNWRLELIARIGCDAPRSVVLTPYGLGWFKTADDAYMYSGGYPRSLTQDTIQSTFRLRTAGLTAAQKLNLYGWYAEKQKSLNFMFKNSDLKEYWSAFLELPVSNTNFAWFRNKTSHNIDWVNVNRQGDVIFLSTNLYKFSTSDLDDAGTAIQCTFDTGDYSFDERHLSYFTRRALAMDQDSSATIAGTLDDQFFVDGAAYTFDSVSSNTSGMTKTLNRHERGLPLGCKGRRFKYKWNTNATPATWTHSGSSATPLTILELGVKTEVKDVTGDMTTT